jgi:hypothetical protein
MNTNKTDPKKAKETPQRPLKPKQPNTEGAPDDHDPKAQYEDKDES